MLEKSKRIWNHFVQSKLEVKYWAVKLLFSINNKKHDPITFWEKKFATCNRLLFFWVTAPNTEAICTKIKASIMYCSTPFRFKSTYSAAYLYFHGALGSLGLLVAAYLYLGQRLPWPQTYSQNISKLASSVVVIIIIKIIK